MARPRDRRRWTIAEDALLREAVSQAIADSRPLLWRELAKSVPGRTNKDCRRRWCNAVAGGAAKGTWTESEDERLSRAVQRHGCKWTRIAGEVGSRTSDQCSSHWYQTLNPGIDYSDWTKEEDVRLIRGVQQLGTNWSKIVPNYLPNRTSLALKNRYSAIRSRADRASTASHNIKKTTRESPRSRTDISTRKDSQNNRLHSAASERCQYDQFPAGNGQDNDEDDEDDDGDEDDDDEFDDDDDQNEGEGKDEGESDGAAFVGEHLFQTDWQKSPTNAMMAPQSQSLPASANNQSTPFRISNHNEGQAYFDATCTSTADGWASGISQDPRTYACVSPLHLHQNGSSKGSLEYPYTSLRGVHSTTSDNLHQYPYTDNFDGAPSPLQKAEAPTGILSNDATYESRKNSDVPTESTAGVLPAFDTDSVVSHAAAQSQTPGFVNQELRGAQAFGPMCSGQALSVASPFLPSPSGGGRPTNAGGQSLQRVSIDALCTPEQLSTIMGNIAGQARSIRVTIDS